MDTAIAGELKNPSKKRVKTRSPYRRDWAQDADCKGVMNFDSPKTSRERQKNRTICLDCPVLDLCLEYALAYSDEEGFWAGTTATERKEIRRHLPQAALGLVALESHSSFEFAPALSQHNPPVARLLPTLDLSLSLML